MADLMRHGDAPPHALRLAPDAARPDPTLGVFTTVLVRGGAPVGLGAHLARLGADIAALGGAPLPLGVAGRAAAAAARVRGDAGRLRLDWRPQAPDEVSVACGPVPRPLPGAVPLAPVLLPGGLGAHKWRDRRLLDALADRLGAVPLIVDADGHVLEAAWASVLALEDDVLVAPREDGRLLPSTARARVCADAATLGLGVRTEPLTLGRLAASDAVLVASALRGPLPAVAPGTRAPAPSPALRELATAWRSGASEQPDADSGRARRRSRARP